MVKVTDSALFGNGVFGNVWQCLAAAAVDHYCSPLIMLVFVLSLSSLPTSVVSTGLPDAEYSTPQVIGISAEPVKYPHDGTFYFVLDLFPIQ